MSVCLCFDCRETNRGVGKIKIKVSEKSFGSKFRQRVRHLDGSFDSNLVVYSSLYLLTVLAGGASDAEEKTSPGVTSVKNYGCKLQR